MKAYLLTTGTIFGLFSLGHIVELITRWRSPASDPWFMGGMALIVVLSAALSIWGFRLWMATHGGAARHDFMKAHSLRRGALRPRPRASFISSRQIHLPQ